MNELQIFNNSDFGEIRTLEENGSPLFCGSDVAKALGYARPNDAIAQHCRYTAKRSTPHPQSPNKLIDMSFVPESDLYRLIVNSKLPTAEKFERWVFEEVLPSIRKHGAYLTPDKLEEVLLNPDTMIQLCQNLKEEQNKRLLLEKEAAAQKQIIAELQPKANYVDKILKNPGLVTITQIAKDYGMSGRELNALLHKRGVQYKESGQWLLYKKYQNEGYTHSKTVQIKHKDGSLDVKMNTKWTQKGRLFLYDLLKNYGYHPAVENQSQKSA